MNFKLNLLSQYVPKYKVEHSQIDKVSEQVAPFWHGFDEQKLIGQYVGLNKEQSQDATVQFIFE